MRKVSPQGRDLIASFEQGPGGGPALVAYLCPAGIWTIGYGHTKGVKQGDRLPSAVAADILLDEDVAGFAQEVDRLIGDADTSQHEFDALVSLAFNVGIGNLAGSTPLRLHRQGKKQEAAGSFGLWNKATVEGKLVALPGLTRRRAAETALYLTPQSDGAIERVAPMPQEVKPPAGAVASKSIWTNVGVATGGVALAASNIQPAIDAVNSAVSTARSAQTTWASLKDLLDSFANGHVYTVVITAAITVGAVYLIRRVVKRVRSGEISA